MEGVRAVGDDSEPSSGGILCSEVSKHNEEGWRTVDKEKKKKVVSNVLASRPVTRASKPVFK